MVDRTLPTLTATSSPADDSIFLIRRNGQTEDEKVTGLNLKAYMNNAPAISGGTINNTVIGGTTPAAGTFTTLAANTIDTGQGAVECYAMNQAVQTTSNVTFNSLTLTTALAVDQGGTGATTASGARTNLGLVIGTNVQAYDAGLQSISGLTTAANNGIYTTALDTYATYSLTAGGRALCGVAGTSGTFPYFSASNTVTLGTITAAGRAILDDADATAQRATLGLVIGTNVQAYDAGLQSISGLTTAADNMIYTTASDTYAVTTLTSFARTLLDDTNNSTARTTLGLGSIATQDSSNVTITGGSITGITDLAVADGGTGSSTASGARTNLGLGTISTQDANNVSISGGSITGIADLALTDGGTGASTAAGARTNLGFPIATNVQFFTAGGTFNVPAGVSTVRVTAAGAGGGGAAELGGGAGGNTTVTDGTTLITAAGGAGGVPAFSSDVSANAHGTGTNGDLNITGGGSPGGIGTGNISGSEYDHGGIGANGALVIKTYTGLTGGSSTLTITIGAAGTAGSVGGTPQPGVAGWVMVEW